MHECCSVIHIFMYTCVVKMSESSKPYNCPNISSMPLWAIGPLWAAEFGEFGEFGGLGGFGGFGRFGAFRAFVGFGVFGGFREHKTLRHTNTRYDLGAEIMRRSPSRRPQTHNNKVLLWCRKKKRNTHTKLSDTQIQGPLGCRNDKRKTATQTAGTQM